MLEFWSSQAEHCEKSTRRLVGKDTLILDAVDSLFPNTRGLDVLDIGSGGGFSSISLARQGHHVTSIDISPDMIESAKRNAGAFDVRVDYFLDDIQRSKMPDSSFDLVVFYETLFTIVDVSSAITEAVRILRPGGRLLIMDGNYFQDQKIERYQARKDYFKMKYGTTEMQIRPEFSDLDYEELERTVKPLYVSRVIHPGWEVWNFLDMGLEDLHIDTTDTEDYIRITPTGRTSVALSYLISARKPFKIPDQPSNIDDRGENIAIDVIGDSCTMEERIFSVLSNRNRVAILRILLASPSNVRRISELLGESQALTSYNLRLLKDNGIVRLESKGRESIYTVVNPPIVRSMLRMAKFIGSGDQDADKG